MSHRIDRSAILASALLLLLVLLVFGGALGNGFVYDDHSLVERNPLLRTLRPATHLAQPFFGERDILQDYYRPAVTWSLALDHALFGMRAWGYHLHNLLLHWLNATLVFLLLRRLGGPAAAAIGAAFFALHPIQNEAVLWVSGRTDLLATFFLLVALWSYSQLGDRLSRRDLPHLAIPLLAFAAALLSKEMAVTFPALILAFDLGLSRVQDLGWRPAFRRSLRRLLVYGGPIALVIGGYLLLRYGIFGRLAEGELPEELLESLPLREASTTGRLLTAVSVAGRYLGLVVFPIRLSVDYQGEVVPVVSSLLSPAFLSGLLALVALAALVAWLAPRHPPAIFGAVSAAGTYLLVSHLLFPGPVLMAERLLYLPMAGLAAIFAALVPELASRVAPARQAGRVAALGAMVVVAALGARSFARVPDWRDDLTLFRAAVRATPQSAPAWSNLGVRQLRLERPEEALESFRRSRTIDPGHRSARINEAVALHRLGRTEEALAALRELLREFPRSQNGWLHLAQMSTDHAAGLAAEGRAEEARLLREELIRDLRGEASGVLEEAGAGVRAALLASLAQNLSRLDRPAEAAPQYLEAAEAARRAGQAPLAAQLSLESGHAFLRSAQASEAEQAYREAERAAGGDAELAVEAREGLAWVLVQEGRLEEAVALAGAREGEATPSGRVLLSAAKSALASDRPGQALPLYDRLVDQEFDPLPVHAGRARARLALGDLAGAEEDLRLALALSPSRRTAAVLWTDLARVSVRAGDEREALRRLERALREDPQADEARRLLERLPR